MLQREHCRAIRVQLRTGKRVQRRTRTVEFTVPDPVARALCASFLWAVGGNGPNLSTTVPASRAFATRTAVADGLAPSGSTSMAGAEGTVPWSRPHRQCDQGPWTSVHTKLDISHPAAATLLVSVSSRCARLGATRGWACRSDPRRFGPAGPNVHGLSSGGDRAIQYSHQEHGGPCADDGCAVRPTAGRLRRPNRHPDDRTERHRHLDWRPRSLCCIPLSTLTR